MHDLEKILNQLTAATRSPRGRFSAIATYPKLERRLNAYRRHLLLMRFASAAAAVALICLSAWVAYLYMQCPDLQTVSTLAETRLVSLPDGTAVTLNRYSTLSYPAAFQSNRREVQLDGEAYFDVKRDERHPFVVQTEAIDVQVLGTRFNVEAYTDNPEVRTTLLSGSVAVSGKGDSPRLVLRPNEMAIYDKEEKRLTAQALEHAVHETAWLQGEFLFDDLPLREIARELSNAFDVKIRITNPTLPDYRITARFRNGEDLETILAVLRQAGYFDYTIRPKEIILH